MYFDEVGMTSVPIRMMVFWMGLFIISEAAIFIVEKILPRISVWLASVVYEQKGSC
jgi:hypothetical protein